MSKERYSDIDDEQLIVRIHDGEADDITDHIMNKYKNLVRKKAASMYILVLSVFSGTVISCGSPARSGSFSRPSFSGTR